MNSVTRVGAFMDILFFFWVFRERAEREARVLGVNLGWKVATVPGIAHDQDRMAQAAAFLLIDK